MTRPRLTVVASHVRRLPKPSPEYIAIHDKLWLEVTTEALCRDLEIAFSEDEGFAARTQEAY